MSTHIRRQDDPLNLLLAGEALAEPMFDPVTVAFLRTCEQDLARHTRVEGSRMHYSCWGQSVPWLYRFDFSTLGLAKTRRGQVVRVEHHVIVLRYLPECLRTVDRFQMLRYAGPREPAPFHPNICPQTGAICVEVFPGESPLEIAESLHDVLRWRIRNLREEESLNRDACQYGRAFVHQPIDDRPLFDATSWELQLQALRDAP